MGTPLGNRGDLSPRAREALLGADLLFCEDTRSPTRLLGNDVSLPPRRSCFVGNEHERTAELLDALAAGQTVAFCSEAGMPSWSDPGQLLVRAAVGAGFSVDVVPGPTAASAALSLSGFDATGACFMGFIARDGKARSTALAQIAAARGPSLLYEAGNRTPGLLRDLAKVLPDAGAREVVVCRELTKLHQEVLRGTVADLHARTTEALRGEVTVVVEGGDAAEAESVDAARAVLDVMLDPSLKPRPRARALADLTGLDAREVYERLRDARS
ncbi:MAG: 16S rRNA (cytidine(1402)-2'-O)-methyltransferase [Nannocystaceae bacterium]|nr:16S rRNA (cytidine(1402)-2'-O)-methyltransferase [bacterium]